MVPRVSALVAAIVFPAVAWVCWRVLELVWLRPKKLETTLRKQGLSANPYRLLFGDTLDFSRFRKEALSKPCSFTNDILPRVIPQLHHHLLHHGENSFTWMGPIPLVYITQPELAREVFMRPNEFGKPQLGGALKLLAPGLACYEGEQWANHRKMLTPAFHIEKLKLMLPAFYESCSELINTWDDMAHGIGSVELDVWPHLTKITGDVISRAAFGSNFKEGSRIFELLSEQGELFIQIFQIASIPGWRFLPTKMNRRMKKIHEEIRGLVLGIVEKRKKKMEAGEGTTMEDRDLLSILMENTVELKMQNSIDNKKQIVGITTEELIEECKLLYIAGQESSSVLLVWTVIMLSKHQDWQERAREEVLKAFGKKKPDFDGLNHLKIVTMILYEVLRLYPSVVALSRVAKQDVELGNLSLPAGVMVNIPTLVVHQDPKLWGDDALEFNPERFSAGIVKATGGNNAFFTFGWGPRICLGINFALLEAKMALALILQRFSMELSPSYTHAPSTVMTLKPQFGAPIMLRQI